MLLATAFIAASSVVASELSIEQVAPEHSVLVMSLDEVGGMMDRIMETPAGQNMKPIEDVRDRFMDGLPESMSDAFGESMESTEDFIKMMSDMKMGLAIYPEVDPETTAVTIGFTMFMDLGEAGKPMGKLWDEAMEQAEEEDSERFEIIEVAETDVIRIDMQDEEMEEEDDPFGGGMGRGGMGMGMDIENAMPDRSYMVRVEDNIMISTSRSQMARMLDIVAGQEIEGGLGESTIWKGMTGYIGERGLRMILLTDHLGELMGAFGQPFIVNMMRPTVAAMFGKIEALGFAVESAESPALATFRMGAWIPEGKTGLMKLMSKNTPREPIPAWVTAETVDYGRLNFDFEGVISWLNDVIDSNPMLAMQAGQMMEQMEPMMDKVLSGIGNRIQMSSSISYPLTAESINSLWNMPAKDGKAFTDAMAEMAPQMGFEPRDFQGHQIYSMDMGGMMGAMGGGSMEMAVAVGGGDIFMGSLPAVEQSLRSVGKRSSEDSEISKKFASVEQYFSSEPVVYWQVGDLGTKMAAEAEVNSMMWSSELDELQAEDPELAAELAEMMGEDDDASFIESVTKWFGVTGLEIMSVEDGFKGQGWVLSPVEE
ncbi:MAG: hypothetical protein CMJ29_03895 [Phycisphaerae bacterium]|nr:hypothetical protein [Phycisphaerae bacterium]